MAAAGAARKASFEENDAGERQRSLSDNKA